MEVKLCLTNLVDLYYDVNNLVDEGRTAHILYLDFRKALCIVSHNIVIDKLKK